MTCEASGHPSVPTFGQGPIDWPHLERASFGDPALMREVLGLFAAQAEQLTRAISNPLPEVAASAHKLKGSAQAIGAWAVAEAAERLEAALVAGGDAATEAAAVLALRLDETCRAIAQYLAQGQ